MKLRKALKNEYDIIRSLYLTAFPREERQPFCLIKSRGLSGEADMLLAEQDGEFIGFAYCVAGEKAVYLFFFAVAEEKRGMGFGTRILALLSEYYPGKSIFLARETLDESAENISQRVRRQEFYLRNGFKDIPARIREANVVYDVMATEQDADISEYEKMMREWAGPIYSRLVKMRLIQL